MLKKGTGAYCTAVSMTTWHNYVKTYAKKQSALVPNAILNAKPADVVIVLCRLPLCITMGYIKATENGSVKSHQALLSYLLSMVCSAQTGQGT